MDFSEWHRQPIADDEWNSHIHSIALPAGDEREEERHGTTDDKG